LTGAQRTAGPSGALAACDPSTRSSPIFIRPFVLLAASALLVSADLPDHIPVPEPRPDNKPAATPADASKEKPQSADVKETPAAEAYVPPPIEKEDPPQLQACLAALDALGVGYEPLPTIADNNGCGVDRPFEVTSLGAHVTLDPAGKMRCETALALARWTADIVTPMLKTAKPGETLVGLDQASTYVCRKRNSAETGKISEHAHGNAVDIAGFRFKSGNTFSIKPRMKDSTLDGAFQRAIATAACLYFTTVLDPGSDKAHETHLHLDVLKRKAGFRYCW
jgi:hypothetical protein